MQESENCLEQFAICLDNSDYRASLEVGKLYPVIRDAEAESHGSLRVVDESGEDYAFAAHRSHLINLPLPVQETWLAASRR
jgi:hypothetical protein